MTGSEGVATFAELPLKGPSTFINVLPAHVSRLHRGTGVASRSQSRSPGKDSSLMIMCVSALLRTRRKRSSTR